MALPFKVIRLVTQRDDSPPSAPRVNDAGKNGAQSPLNCEERFQALVDGVVDYAIFMIDPAGIVKSWNLGAERIKGYRASDILGRHFSCFYPQDAIDRGKPKYHLEVAASTGRCEDEGYRVRKDGTTFWANVVLTALRDPQGNLTGFAKVTRDLTERRNAEQKLRDSDEQFRLLMDGIVDYGIFMLNPIGVVTTWNAGAERLMGYKADEIIGQHFSRFFLSEDIKAGLPKNELDVAAALGRFVEQGWRKRNDGSRFWADVTVSALRDSDERLIGFAKVTRDLTARREADEQIEKLRLVLQLRNENLAATNADLEAFSRSMAHDLKAPVRHILAYADILLRDGKDRLPDDALDHIMHMQKSAMRMSALVRDLLGWFTIARRTVRTSTVSLQPLVKSIIAEFAPETMNREIEWRVSNLFDLACDRGLVTLLFQNLIDNALKFTRGRERAVIEIGHVVTDTDRVIFVRDNGAGFDMDYVGKLFHAFERLHPHADFEGSGIGLTIAARIVQKHGGRIWADAAPGQGATFHFTLEDCRPR
jgi:PAS domain S-box-containing protein